MGHLTVTMTDVNGVTRVIDNADAGVSLMELARSNDVAGIAGDCGGGCACATCHVYVDAAWWGRVGGPDDIEASMLDMAEAVQDRSRLACQITMTDALDGISVTVAPGA